MSAAAQSCFHSAAVQYLEPQVHAVAWLALDAELSRRSSSCSASAILRRTVRHGIGQMSMTSWTTCGGCGGAKLGMAAYARGACWGPDTGEPAAGLCAKNKRGCGDMWGGSLAAACQHDDGTPRRPLSLCSCRLMLCSSQAPMGRCVPAPAQQCGTMLSSAQRVWHSLLQLFGMLQGKCCDDRPSRPRQVC